MKIATQKEFETYVIDHIKEYLPEHLKDAEVEIGEVVKNNGCIQRKLNVHPNDSIVAPSVDLEPAYEMAMETSPEEALSDLAMTVARGMEEDHLLTQIIDAVGSFDSIKDKIYVRLINAEKNQKLLETVPHTMVGDLAATYRVAFPVPEKDAQTSFVINHAMAQGYGVDTKTLHAVAEENARDQVVVTSLYDQTVELMAQSMGISTEEAKEMAKEMIPPMDDMDQFVVTNKACIDGAGMMAFDSVRQHVAAYTGGDYYMLPSSVHEVIVLPASDPSRRQEEVESLTAMVREVNRTAVTRQEVLSDNVYHYNALSRELTVETGREQKLTQEQKHTMRH